MSKYQPLVHHLDKARTSRVPMSFDGMEEVLHFPLPRSARRHQAWWANTDSHVHAVAWMKRGWRTSCVDLAGEKVIFVREASPSAESSRDFGNGPGDDLTGNIVIAWADLRDGHRRLLQDIMSEEGVSLAGAVSEALDMAFRERRREVLEWAAANARKVENPSDSVDLIREDRDRDEL